MIAVHFGAGNIGRGFIGQVLHDAGYKVVFVDVDKDVVDAIHTKGKYNIVLADDASTTITIDNVDAINSTTDEPSLIKVISEADLITTSVGPNVLPIVAKSISKGLNSRLQGNTSPLNIMACENMIGASDALQVEVLKNIDPALKHALSKFVGFCNTAVDRIVPVQKHEDRLTVTVEPFCEWLIDETNMVGDIESIGEAKFVPDLLPYIERKLFTVNTMHTAVAYAGAYFGSATILEALKIKPVQDLLKGVCNETGEYLIKKHGLDRQEVLDYQQKTLNRIANKHIVDKISRVARQPIRKLGSDERFVKPALGLVELEIEVGGDMLAGADLTASKELVAVLSKQFGIDESLLQDEAAIKQALSQLMGEFTAVMAPMSLARVIALTLLYRDSNDEQAVQLENYIKTIGVEDFLTQHCGISEDNILMQLITQEYLNLLNAKRNR